MRAAGIDQAVLKPFGKREICSGVDADGGESKNDRLLRARLRIVVWRFIEQ